MKNITKNTKTTTTSKMIIMSVIITLMLVPMTLAMAVNGPGSEDPDPSGGTQVVDENIEQGDISIILPEDELLPRLANEWASQYENLAEFEAIQNTVETYVTAELPDNGWNQAVVKDQIKIQNFDTMIGKRGHGHEIVALYVTQQKILGTYSNVHKFLYSQFLGIVVP